MFSALAGVFLSGFVIVRPVLVCMGLVEISNSGLTSRKGEDRINLLAAILGFFCSYRDCLPLSTSGYLGDESADFDGSADSSSP